MDKDQGATLSGVVAAIGTGVVAFVPPEYSWIGQLLQVLGIAVLGFLSNKK